MLGAVQLVLQLPSCAIADVALSQCLSQALARQIPAGEPADRYLNFTNMVAESVKIVKLRESVRNESVPSVLSASPQAVRFPPSLA